MKAAQFREYGGPEVIELVQNAPKPIAKPGYVVVEVHSASLNRIDSGLRSGFMKDMLPLSLPATLGGDFAGVVAEIGEGVSGFAVGDEVYGQAGPFLGGSGSLAEYAAADSGKVAKKPTSVNMAHAAAFPLVASSALQALEEHIQITAGQRILIHGGAGGVGSIAVQLAKLHGAYVTATARGEDADYVRSMGADEVIDYKVKDFTKILKEYDAVFDTAGGDVVGRSLNVLKKGGTLVTVAGRADEAAAQQREVTVIHQMTKVSTEQLERIAELVDGGKITIKVDTIYSFTDAKEAYLYYETKQPKGKIVVSVK